MDDATGGEVLSIVGPLGIAPELIPVVAGVLWGLGAVCTGLVVFMWLRVSRQRVPQVTMGDMLFTAAAWKRGSVAPEAQRDQTVMVGAFISLLGVALALAWFGLQVNLMDVPPLPTPGASDVVDPSLR